MTTQPHDDTCGLTIYSGGQTGADRAALDWAISENIPHGGWCPKGRKAENGPIPARYQLQETVSTGYADRTERNVMEADATVVFTLQQRLSSGSALTYSLAAMYRKPVLHLHEGTVEAGRRLAAFIRQNRVKILNVAGPRASSAPGISSFVANTLDKALHELRKCTR
ncbi:MAG: putative molybdenum carrier protein [Limisphaerales bacterium]